MPPVMRSLLAITTLLSALTVPAIAAADDTTEERLTHAHPTEWYGWQILTSDAATLATTLVLFNVEKNENVAGTNFYAGYLLGGPIVHAAHGNLGTAVGSLAVRAGMPIAGTFVGCAAYGDQSEMLGCLPGAALGFLIGMGGAIAIDASALAYRDAKPKPKSFEVLPSANMSKTGATFGLQGSF
jgi:hypothetical protein